MDITRFKALLQKIIEKAVTGKKRESYKSLSFSILIYSSLYNLKNCNWSSVRLIIVKYFYQINNY